ncbi:hypothetical protein FOPG_08134 [Fusarium oxysporum f. sp. conglutinans race 2 54008]|uniref:Uncharacterized protein n=2 Tax=Fusarium oxysporum TaxID=5507 RepID=X0L5E0_FUSOX|nr:hypothetical protein FOPG_08134 [Fusarium oxysporum f. sp. conglutinans race 2 54008]EXM16196.1 hypothetical protein FOTG_15491 [Fusarium oxysporum f. sp. vasinfectum 25433]
MSKTLEPKQSFVLEPSIKDTLEEHRSPLLLGSAKL